MQRRAGLRARPKNWPWWLRPVRAYLGGLRRKDLKAYRAMRGRLAEAWPTLSGAFERVAEGAMAAVRGKHVHTRTDAGVVCALTLESFAWWAAEERLEVRAIRAAERELIALQDRISAAVDELCEAVTRADELRHKFDLRVDAPMWRDPLAEVLGEAAHRFARWGQEPKVRAFLDFETRSFFSPRPGMLDLVKAARSVGVLHSDAANPARSPFTQEWLRTVAPAVKPDNALAQQAIRTRAGSGPESEAAQLRQLFAGLREVALKYGWQDDEPGPLDWLTDTDVSALCCALIGDGQPTKSRPWGAPAHGFDPETVRNARAVFAGQRMNRKS